VCQQCENEIIQRVNGLTESNLIQAIKNRAMEIGGGEDMKNAH